MEDNIEIIGYLTYESDEVIINDEIQFSMVHNSGSYPVYVQTNKEGKVEMAIIDFDNVFLREEGPAFILEYGEE